MKLLRTCQRMARPLHVVDHVERLFYTHLTTIWVVDKKKNMSK